ncbi:hypothetical protein [Leptospira santarosai]|uniref:hypothetical protein n=1 Tax=Leptospira santarosai TaxID=28183 RepID=UPI000B0A469C|nr:hypothetical protein [Leptospira santarosai]
MIKTVKKIIQGSLIALFLLQVGWTRPSDKTAGNDYSVLLSLIGYALVSIQQGPCGKYITASSSPQNLNFVPYVNSGINFSGAIIYMPNVKTNNKLLLCSSSNVNFYQSANFSMRSNSNCSGGIFNTPRVNNVLGANALVGNCYSYPIQIDGSFALSVFIEGSGFPNDAQVYLQ